MKQYYLNPKTRDLLIFDDQESDITIVERIEKVRVWVKGEIKLGDFDGPNRGKTVEDDDERGGYTNSNYDPKNGKVRKQRKQQTCKKCGKPGHRSDNVDFHPQGNEPSGA
jgi:hypothetical protein